MQPEVYVLKLVNDQYYIGSTNDIERRLIEHNSGKTRGIKYRLPAKLVFSRKCNSLLEARQIEQKLKKLKNKDIIKRIISDQRIDFLGA